MKPPRRVRVTNWFRRHTRDLTAAAALAAIAAGFWLAWPPLGLIVPGAIVLACVARAHLTGGPPDAA